MPFSLTNVIETFHRMMETCLGHLDLHLGIIYLDNIIIFSKTCGEQIKQLCGVFEKLAEAGLKVEPSKCKLFHTWINYLGHSSSKDGIETNLKRLLQFSTGHLQLL